MEPKHGDLVRKLRGTPWSLIAMGRWCSAAGSRRLAGMQEKTPVKAQSSRRSLNSRWGTIELRSLDVHSRNGHRWRKGKYVRTRRAERLLRSDERSRRRAFPTASAPDFLPDRPPF